MKTVFYSWQSDLDNSCNRNLIENALKAAIKGINATILEGDNFELDKDTLNEPGSPDIVETILGKIDKCNMFVADITPISRSGEKTFPNPNVLLELGYAIGKLGITRVVCLNNQHFHTIESLPFDLKTKRILGYECSPEAEADKRKDIVKRLSSAFKKNLKLIASSPPKESEEKIESGKIQKERDVKKIKRLAENLPIGAIHRHIDIGTTALHMDSDVFTAYYNILSVFGFGTFILYNKECFDLIKSFVDKLSRTLQYGSCFHYYQGTIYKFDQHHENEQQNYIDDLA